MHQFPILATGGAALKPRTRQSRSINIIPDTPKEKPHEEEILAVRLGTRDQAGQLDETTVKTADRVPFGEWSGSYVRIDGKDLLILKRTISSAKPRPNPRSSIPHQRACAYAREKLKHKHRLLLTATKRITGQG